VRVVTGPEPRAGVDPAPALLRVVTGLVPAAGEPVVPWLALVRVVTGAETEPDPPADPADAVCEALARVVTAAVPAAARLPPPVVACLLAPVLTERPGPSAGAAPPGATGVPAAGVRAGREW
jgi:hypothetical protein